MKKRCRAILIALIMLPLVAFFPGCNCSGSGGGDDGLNSYCVKFYTNSGENNSHTYEVKIVKHGDTVEPPKNNPTKEKCVFRGWYKDPELTIQWKFESEKVYADTTIYARFDEINISS